MAGRTLIAAALRCAATARATTVPPARPRGRADPAPLGCGVAALRPPRLGRRRRRGRPHRRRGARLGHPGRGRPLLRRLPRARRRPGSTSSSATCRSAGRAAGRARRGGARARPRTRPAGRSSGGPARCSTCCSARPGLDRAECAVLNVVKCRPPGNRTPKAPEVARCSGWLRRQLELLDPPASWRSGCRRRSGSSARGRCWRRCPRAGRTVVDGRAVWATYHPSAAIRFGPNGAPRAALLADLHAPSRGDAAVKREHVLPDAGGHPGARARARRAAAARRPRRPGRAAGGRARPR